MNEKEHFERLNQYFEKSKVGYDVALWGSKHFGFYPKEKKISHESPLGKALIGRKVGETVEVQAPAGKVEYTIVGIE